MKQICSICGGYYDGWGNNARPINDGRCCDRCDALVVFRRLNDAGYNLPPELLDGLKMVLAAFPLTPGERLAQERERPFTE